MVNNMRKDFKTISTDLANKRRNNNASCGIDTGWIGATLVLDITKYTRFTIG